MGIFFLQVLLIVFFFPLHYAASFVIVVKHSIVDVQDQKELLPLNTRCLCDVLFSGSFVLRIPSFAVT